MKKTIFGCFFIEKLQCFQIKYNLDISWFMPYTKRIKLLKEKGFIIYEVK